MSKNPSLTPEERVTLALSLSASSGVSPEQALQMLIHAEVAGERIAPVTVKKRIGTVALWTFAVLGVMFTALVVIALIAQAIGGTA